ncbi:MAG: hypothetical protein HYZ47_05230 [Simkania negevensis]|nr:hypothetical protein [Simkania negevensis]
MHRFQRILFSTFLSTAIGMAISQQGFCDADSEMDPATETNVFGKAQGQTCSASVDQGFTIRAGFLYLQARQGGLDYVQKIDVTVPSSLVDPLLIDSKQRTLDFEWEPGVTVSLGYIFPQRQQWEASLTWNYFTGRAHDSLKTDDPLLGTSSLKPYLFPYFIGSSADKASAHWKLNFNTLDLMLSRSYFIGKYIAVKPAVGLRGAWIDQHFQAKYHGAHSLNGLLILQDTSFKNHTDFSGGGLRIGTDLQWFMGTDWCILGSFSGSLIYGHFHSKEKVNGFIIPDPAFTLDSIYNTKQNQNQIIPNLEGKLGIQWQTFFHNEQYKVSLGAFYTMGYWFDQNKLFNINVSLGDSGAETFITPNFISGDLQYQGVSFDLAFEF